MTATREQVLSTLRERIVAYAASRIGRDTAEDLAQEALLLLEEKYAHLDRMEDLLPLTFQILRFKMNDYRRKTLRRGEYTAVPVEDVPLSDPQDNPLAAAEQKQLEQRLAEAIAKLEGRCREIFRMKLEGMTFAEIQKVLGAAAINTVYTWDFRCRKSLLELMGGSWEAPR